VWIAQNYITLFTNLLLNALKNTLVYVAVRGARRPDHRDALRAASEHEDPGNKDFAR
jgi:hypothetical protein